MPGSDHEVFQYLKSDPANSEAENNLTFALFAREKDEWIKHFTGQHQRPPSQGEIDGWTANISDYHFSQMRSQAASFFDVAARAYLTEEIETGKREVLESAIIARVQSAGAFHKQLSIALLTAVLAPIIIGSIIAAFLAYNKVFPTFVQVPATSQMPAAESRP